MTSSTTIPEVKTPDGFSELVSDAYDHLHDIVYLHEHPLVGYFVPPLVVQRSPGRQLHELLRALIDELDSGPDMPAFGPEWRRHRYMVLRYLRGQNHQTIADTFHIGLRQYYRLRHTILQEVSEALWARRIGPEADPEQDDSTDEHPRLGLLREESRRMAQSSSFAPLAKIVDDLRPLIDAILARNSSRIAIDIAASLPMPHVPQGVLRQLILGMVTCTSQGENPASLHLSAVTREDEIVITCSRTADCSEPATVAQIAERISDLDEIARQVNCQIGSIVSNDQLVAIDLHSPFLERTILCIDDNEDLLALMRGYLQPKGYRVLTANSADDGFEMARQQHPDAIITDIMMPGHDGWEILQHLVSDPETTGIPVLVCSVLRQEELALALGAKAYLPKPITQHALTTALALILAT